IGPFIPPPDTPLKDAKLQPFENVLRATALLRILLPKANIPATTASGTVDPLGREKVLKAGANVLMPNITPVMAKKNYLLYPNKICIDESGFATFSSILREKTRMEIIQVLISLLHLAQEKRVSIYQEKLFGEILIAIIEEK
ncbi:MAG: hypothetical protein QXZ30_02970, partial [Candidatus Bilamarchaeaceae archaeon]